MPNGTLLTLPKSKPETNQLAEKLLALDLNWDLAIRRFKRDIRDDFFPDPRDYSDLTRDYAHTVKRIEQRLRSFKARPAVCYDVPKKGFTLRESYYLSPLDRIVYQALVDPLVDHIDPKFSDKSFSHRKRPGENRYYIFKQPVEQWKLFERGLREACRKLPDGLIVVTDVASFYENISFRQLNRALETLVQDDPRLLENVQVLIKLLKAWSPYRWHGLPQNMDPSSFLGNVYLHEVDQRMYREGFETFRYMDDIRVAVETQAEARRALKALHAALRPVGLGLNSGKTDQIQIGTSDFEDLLERDDSTVEAIDQAIRSGDPERIQGAVDPLFGLANELLDAGKVDDRKFRFCINRIRQLKRYRDLDLPDDRAVIKALLNRLIEAPVETESICRYLQATPPGDPAVDTEICRLLTSEPRAIYEWQNYRLWLLAIQRRVKADELLSRAHRSVTHRAPGTEPELAGAALYLGALGDSGDLRTLESAYSDDAPLFVKRSITMALQRLHPADRSLFYREGAKAEEPETALLCEELRNLEEPRFVEPLPPLAADNLWNEVSGSHYG